MVPRLLTRSYESISVHDSWPSPGGEGGEEKRFSTYRFGHTDTGIAKGESLSLLIWNDVNSQVLTRVELRRVREGLIANLVKRVRGVGDEFSQEDLLVGVDRVDNKREKLGDLRLELERLAGHDEIVGR